MFFFFQAEDGIRDLTVTGVQTCALPISSLFCRWHIELRECFRNNCAGCCVPCGHNSNSKAVDAAPPGSWQRVRRRVSDRGTAHFLPTVVLWEEWEAAWFPWVEVPDYRLGFALDPANSTTAPSSQ